MAKVKFSRGQQSSYNTKKNNNTLDPDTIYVTTDTGNIYLGSEVLFESDAFKNASISGKTVTFTTHGDNGTTGSKTLDLSSFATSSEVSAAIAAAVGSVYKPAGTIRPADITSSLLVAANEGNVYNVGAAFTLSSNGINEISPNLFVDGVNHSEYPAGTNIVVVLSSKDPDVYKFDILSGFVDLSNYVQKVVPSASGNLAALDANGNVTDGGVQPSDFKTKQAAVSDPTASGNTLTAIATISQNANGQITATKKNIQSASTSQKGVVQLLDSHTSTATDKAATPKNVKEAYDLASGKVSDVKVGTTANDAASVVDANHVAQLLTGSAYDASTNKIATMNDTGTDWGSF